MLHRLLTLTALLSILTLAVVLPGTSQSTTVPDDETALRTQVEESFGGLPLLFEENQGQWDEQVAYAVQGHDKTLYFTPDGVTFALTAPAADRPEPLQPDRHDPLARLEALRERTPTERWVVKLDFLGANPDVRPVGEAKDEAIISYFKGQPDDWHTAIPTYRRLVYHDLWPGIDLVYEGTASRLKYHFVVQPGADPAQIQLAYRGATDVSVNGEGQLEVTTPLASFQDDTPVAYQEVDGERVPVEMAYALEPASGESQPYHFDLGAYDPELPLVLDPAVLVYAGYIGGNSSDEGRGIAIDAAGNAYVTGSTFSSETTFPALVGPDLTYNGGQDVFVAKVSPSGAGLVYAGYIGGSDGEYGDVGYGIAVDAAGSAYVTGGTDSSEATFPVLVGPDLTFNGLRDAFVAKVSPSGAGLVYAGYIGGSEYDNGYGIAVDAAGNGYVTGYTWSSEATFPVLVGPDLTHNGNGDAFVAKVSPSGARLFYAGYIGGSDDDRGYDIAVDAAGSAYVTGRTSSSEATFPVLVGPDLTFNGDDDAFVAKVSPSGAGLVYAGYIGGSEYDNGYGIAIDAAANAYITGRTSSSEATFPVVVGPDLTFNGDYDAFVAKVSPSGAGLVYAGYIGGSGGDYGEGIAVDAAGSAYVTGTTDSHEATFPVLVGPDLTHNGLQDTFVAKVNPSGAGLVYAGYIGGGAWDWGNDIAVDAAGSAYVTGGTDSSGATFPVLVGPDLTFNGGAYDAFVAKVGSSTGSCAVPYFSQRDPRWLSHPLRTNGTCSAYCSTIGSCGCTLTAAAMLFTYYGANLTPATLSDCMWSQACPFNWGTGESCSQGEATWVGRYPFSWQLLDQQLNQHSRPVILGMHRAGNVSDTHWVLVVSGQGGDPANYTIHDPWPIRGEIVPLSARTRDNYVLDWIAVYAGEPDCTVVAPQPAPAAIQPQSVLYSLEENHRQEPEDVSAYQSIAVPSQDVTGSVFLYHMTELTMTLQLTATSSFGQVTEMQVWTDANPNPVWQPFAEYVWLNWFPEHDVIYARFRDEFGNISSVETDTTHPVYSPPPEPPLTQIWLPSVLNSP